MSRIAAALPLLALAALSAQDAAAQYKVVGPDGRITYTDRPPVASGAKVTALGRTGSGNPEADPATAGLPLDLRTVAARYPVLLYSTSECPSCDAGRQLLRQRGVPYVERQVLSNADSTALDRLLGWRTVPSLTIGTQALRGLNLVEWAAYLDAAGYPKDSQLPRGWQPPPPTPLTPPPAKSAAAPAPRPEPSPPPAPAPPPLEQPASDERPNIRF